MKMNIVEKALKLQNNGFYYLGHFILSVYGIEIPKEVEIKQLGGDNTMRLVHRAPGLVLHPKTIVGKRVHFYQGVTVGKKNIYEFTKLCINDAISFIDLLYLELSDYKIQMGLLKKVDVRLKMTLYCVQDAKSSLVKRN